MSNEIFFAIWQSFTKISHSTNLLSLLSDLGKDKDKPHRISTGQCHKNQVVGWVSLTGHINHAGNNRPSLDGLDKLCIRQEGKRNITRNKSSDPLRSNTDSDTITVSKAILITRGKIISMEAETQMRCTPENWKTRNNLNNHTFKRL